MVTRGFFVNSISKFEFDDNGTIHLDFKASEINKSNIKTISTEIGLSPYNLATLLEIKYYENFKEQIDQIQIVEGKSTTPLMLVVFTNNSTLTIGKVWFNKNSPISYDEFITTLLDARVKYGVKLINDTINLLSYGE